MTYIQKLLERLSVPNLGKSLGKKRGNMPQLTKFDDFQKDLEDSGHKLTQKSVRPSSLIPTQNNFNQDKVERLKENGWNDKPIISTQDGYVVDGHHRWLAAHQLKQNIDTKEVDMDADDLLDFCKDKPYVQTKNINESQQ